VRLKDIATDTILAIEIASSDVAGEPGDVDIEHISASITQGIDGRGVHGDYSRMVLVWFLGIDVPLDELKNSSTIDAAKRHSRTGSSAYVI